MIRFVVVLFAMLVTISTATAGQAHKECAALRTAGYDYVGQYSSAVWYSSPYNSAEGTINQFVVDEATRFVNYKLGSNFDRAYEQMVANPNVTTDDCYALVYGFADEAVEYLEFVLEHGELPYAPQW